MAAHLVNHPLPGLGLVLPLKFGKSGLVKIKRNQSFILRLFVFLLLLLLRICSLMLLTEVVFGPHTLQQRWALNKVLRALRCAPHKRQKSSTQQETEASTQIQHFVNVANCTSFRAYQIL